MAGFMNPTARKRPDIENRPVQAPAKVRDLLLSPYPGITYYDIPPLKPTVYKWETAAAFFFNSIAGGAQVLAVMTDLRDSHQNRSVVRTGRYLAAAAGLLSTGLLISELHTRQRWFNMLRLFKKTSPMSIGIWSITPFVALSTLAAIGQAAEDMGYEKPGRLMGKMFGIPAAALGTVVMTYMGTELEETNIPLWASAYPLLAPLYAAGGISNAAAALQLQAEMSAAPAVQKTMLNRIALISGTLETALAAFLGRRWTISPESGFFKGSAYSALYGFGFLEAGLIAPLITNLLNEGGGNREHSRFFLVGPGLKLAGGLLLQLIMIYAGNASGNQLKDYFESTQPAVTNGREKAKLPAEEKIRTAIKQDEPPVKAISSRAGSRSYFTSALAVGAAVIAGAILGARQNRPGGRS